MGKVSNFIAYQLSTYTTVKTIQIKSQRLAIGNIIVTVVVIVLGLLNVLLSHSAASFETPSSVVNIWFNYPSLANLNGTQLSQPLRVTGFPYCNNATYNVPPTSATSGFGASNISCVQMASSVANSIASNEFISLSFVQETDITTPTQPKTTNTFLTQVEDQVVNFQHSAATSFGSFTNPRTRLRSGVTGEVFMDLPKGIFKNRITIGDLLKLAGVDLEEDLPGWKVKQRMSGVVITIRLTYSNLRPNDLSSETICDAYVIRQPGLWGTIGYHFVEDEQGKITIQRLQRAVRIQFDSAGTLGAFNFTSFLLSVVSIVVTLGASKVLVDVIAWHFHPQFRSNKKT
eukprot:CAMPEP_0175133232 /NCGR_PEP_ID=MMETSP0087-20121206/7527_1 /TAXON_ID=136419 /ORGANISM="Unknown Unknown, Strain D1" /LENGTH=343 /DNA_ID=CAMNT_0016415697 /DNA_START=80 /DNA_END=1107 /DNA_ORIENTATION=+